MDGAFVANRSKVPVVESQLGEACRRGIDDDKARRRYGVNERCKAFLRVSFERARTEGVTYAQERENVVQKESIHVQKVFYLYVSILNEIVINVIIYKC